MIGHAPEHIFVATYNNGQGDIIKILKAHTHYSAFQYAETIQRLYGQMVSFREHGNKGEGK